MTVDFVENTPTGATSAIVCWGSAEPSPDELWLVELAYEVGLVTTFCKRCGSGLGPRVRVATWPTVFGPVRWRVSAATRCQGWRRHRHTAIIGRTSTDVVLGTLVSRR